MSPPSSPGGVASPTAGPPQPGAPAAPSTLEGKPLPGAAPKASNRRRQRVLVAAVIPCYNRPDDVRKLLGDLARLDARGIDLWIVVVDNASSRPISDLPTPEGLKVEHLRLGSNTGGSGGFNAGVAHVLRGDGISALRESPDFLWLLDSDVRVTRRALRPLVRALLSRPDLAAVGSALVDSLTGVTYEIGGRLNPSNGYFVPAARGDVDKRLLVPADYLAACSALVRRQAIEKTGCMPDIFIHGDDVEWFLRMTRATGLGVAGVPTSRVFHPLWSRKFQTWARYYTTRNSYAPIAVCGLGPRTRFRRSSVDVVRAVAQALMGMPELGDLHLQGLGDAAQGRLQGFGPRGGIGAIAGAIKIRPFADLAATVRAELAGTGSRGRLYFHPMLAACAIDFPGLTGQMALLGARWTEEDLAPWRRRALHSRTLRDMLGAMGRWIMAGVRGWDADVAVVPTGWPTSWFRGRVLVQVTSDGFFVRRISRGGTLRHAARTLLTGAGLIAKVTLRGPRANDLPPAPTRQTPLPSRRAGR